MNKLLLAIAAALLFAASGCGGGAGRSTVMPSGAGATATSTAVGSATVQLTIPIATAAANAVGHATPQYVSSGTASITIKQGSALLGTFNTTATSPGCAATTAGLQCSFSIAPLVGTNQVFTVTAYTQANAAGAVLSSGTTTATVAANTNTPIAVTMGGQVASLGVTLPNVAAGSAVSAPFVVLAKDAAGSTIIGPGSYSSPITISAGANGGLIQLSVNGGSAASSIQVTSPADVPRIVYNGHNISFATITASTTPPGASAVTLSTFFAPVPTVVATHVGTFPNVSVYANTGTADTQTGSFWLGVLDNTLGQWALLQITWDGNATELGLNQVGTGPQSIFANGPNGLIWFTQSGAVPPSYGSMDPVTHAIRLYADASNQNCVASNIFPGPAGQELLYATGPCNDTGQYTLFALDAVTGNVDARLTSPLSQASADGAFVYGAGASNQILTQIALTGTRPALSLAQSGQAAFAQATVIDPIAAPDGSLWDSFGCGFAHTVPAAPLTATAPAYFTLPASMCFSNSYAVARKKGQSINANFVAPPFFTPDGGVWTTGNGFIAGLPQTATPSNYVFSAAAIPAISESGSLIPFEYTTPGFAPNGNMVFFEMFNNNLQYATVEVAY
jgi:hypothetical protein